MRARAAASSSGRRSGAAMVAWNVPPVKSRRRAMNSRCSTLVALSVSGCEKISSWLAESSSVA
jgi:hypothetical protein